MKAKEKESLKNLSVEELRSELRQTREKRMKLLFRHKTTPLANPVELRELRRRIARIETWLSAMGKEVKA